MKDFELTSLWPLIDQALREEPTGDNFLDDRYVEQIGMIGHTNPYYKLFYLIAQALQPRLTVELGSFQATAAAHFAAGYPAGQVITIDIHKDDKDAQVRTREAATHYPNLTYLNEWTWDAVGQVKQAGPIDILFIDSWHEYQYLSRDWADYSPLLADPALVIIDDIYNSPPTIVDIDKFWREVTVTTSGLLDERVHPGIPMGFMRWGSEAKADDPDQTGSGRRAGGTQPATAKKPRTRKSAPKRRARTD